MILEIKINFEPSNEKFYQITDLINGFVHKVLGENNKWHDLFSPYSISNIHGGKGENGYLTFPNGGYFMIHSNDKEFIEVLISGLYKFKKEGISLDSMKYTDFSIRMIDVKRNFDKVVVENVRLKDNDKEITFISDVNFLDKLRENCIKKLVNNNIPFEEASTLKFEPYHEERWKKSIKKIKNVCIETSKIGLKIYGKKIVRETLYNLGLGQSTGCGCGFINVRNID